MRLCFIPLTFVLGCQEPVYTICIDFLLLQHFKRVTLFVVLVLLNFVCWFSTCIISSTRCSLSLR